MNIIDNDLSNILITGELAITELETYLMSLNFGKEKFEPDHNLDSNFSSNHIALLLKQRETADRALKSFLSLLDNQVDIEIPEMDIPFLDTLLNKSDIYPNIAYYVYSKLDLLYDKTFSTCAELKRMLEFFKRAYSLIDNKAIM